MDGQHDASSLSGTGQDHSSEHEQLIQSALVYRGIVGEIDFRGAISLLQQYNFLPSSSSSASGFASAVTALASICGPDVQAPLLLASLSPDGPSILLSILSSLHQSEEQNNSLNSSTLSCSSSSSLDMSPPTIMEQPDVDEHVQDGKKIDALGRPRAPKRAKYVKKAAATVCEILREKQYGMTAREICDEFRRRRPETQSEPEQTTLRRIFNVLDNGRDEFVKFGASLHGLAELSYGYFPGSEFEHVPATLAVGFARSLAAKSAAAAAAISSPSAIQMGPYSSSSETPISSNPFEAAAAAAAAAAAVTVSVNPSDLMTQFLRLSASSSSSSSSSSLAAPDLQADGILQLMNPALFVDPTIAPTSLFSSAPMEPALSDAFIDGKQQQTAVLQPQKAKRGRKRTRNIPQNQNNSSTSSFILDGIPLVSSEPPLVSSSSSSSSPFSSIFSAMGSNNSADIPPLLLSSDIMAAEHAANSFPLSSTSSPISLRPIDSSYSYSSSAFPSPIKLEEMPEHEFEQPQPQQYQEQDQEQELQLQQQQQQYASSEISILESILVAAALDVLNSGVVIIPAAMCSPYPYKTLAEAARAVLLEKRIPMTTKAISEVIISQKLARFTSHCPDQTLRYGLVYSRSASWFVKFSEGPIEYGLAELCPYVIPGQEHMYRTWKSLDSGRSSQTKMKSSFSVQQLVDKVMEIVNGEGGADAFAEVSSSSAAPPQPFTAEEMAALEQTLQQHFQEQEAQQQQQQPIEDNADKDELFLEALVNSAPLPPPAPSAAQSSDPLSSLSAFAATGDLISAIAAISSAPLPAPDQVYLLEQLFKLVGSVDPSSAHSLLQMVNPMSALAPIAIESPQQKITVFVSTSAEDTEEETSVELNMHSTVPTDSILDSICAAVNVSRSDVLYLGQQIGNQYVALDSEANIRSLSDQDRIFLVIK